MRPTAANYIRLVTLHEYCWRTGKRQWANHRHKEQQS